MKIHHLYTYVYFSLVYFISKIDIKVKMHIGFACFFVIYPCLAFLIFFPWGDQEKVGITERTGLYICLSTTSHQPCVPRDVCFPVWETWEAHIPCHKIKHHSVQRTFYSLQPYFQLYFQSISHPRQNIWYLLHMSHCFISLNPHFSPLYRT